MHARGDGSLRWLPAAPALLGLVLLVPGCATRREQAEPIAFEPATAASRAALLGELLPWARADGAAPATLEERTEDGAWRSRFEIVEGPHAGKRMIVSRRDGETPGNWTITREIEGRVQPLEKGVYRIDPGDGSLIMPRLLNYERGVRVEMDPPGLTFPARLEPGESVARESRMRLPLLGNPSRLREQGTGRSQVSLIGAQRVRTRAGTFDALHLREVFESRFSSATAVRTIDRWFAPNAGLIAETWSEEVRALGIVIERSRQAILALPPSPGSDETASRPSAEGP